MNQPLSQTLILLLSSAKYRLFTLCIILFIPDFVAGQSGFANISNFSRSETRGAAQNWAAAQHPNGMMYFANNNGVYWFNGVSWKGTIVNRRQVNDLTICDDGTVYIAAEGEFGTLQADSLHTAHYKSLISYLPEDHPNFRTVNQVVCSATGANFIAEEHIFQWNSDSIRVHTFPNSRIRATRDDIYMLEENRVLKKIETDISDVLNAVTIFATDQDEFTLNYLVARSDGELIMNMNSPPFVRWNGVNYSHFPTEIDYIFEEHRIYDLISLSDGSIAMATSGNGVFVIDQSGALIAHYDMNAGLPTNTVYGVYEDNQFGLWAMHDTGISRIEHFSPIKRIGDQHGAFMTITDITRFHEDNFLASTSGTFQVDNATNTIRPFEPPIRWSWTTSVLPINDEFLTSGSNGIAIYDRNYDLSAHLLPGTAAFPLHQSRLDSNIVFFTQFRSLKAIHKTDNGWEVTDLDLNIPNYSILLSENTPGDLWIAPSNNFVFRLQYSVENGQINVSEFRQFTDEDGLPESNLGVFQAGDKDRFTSRNYGIYIFNSNTSTFIKDESLHDNISDSYVFRMAEDHQKNIWLRSEGFRSIGIPATQKILQPNTSESYNLQLHPLSRIENVQINAIYPEQNGDVWFGGSQVLIQYDANNEFDYKRSERAVISQVFIRRDSLIFDGYVAPHQDYNSPIFPYVDNELRFRYGIPFYDMHEENQFQVRLLPIEQDWHAWSFETTRDYTNLREGNYRFEVRARDIYDNISEAAFFDFRVLPPWYRTWWAYFLFGLAFFGFIYSLHRYRITQITRVFETRNRIASDLHDEVSATISSISFFTVALRNAGDDRRKRERFLKLIEESADDSREKISDIVWSVSPDHDDWKMLFVRFRRFASDVLESRGIDHQISIPDAIKPVKMDMNVRRDLWLMMKEIVNNAVKHSECNNVRIVVRLEKKILTIKISDDGKGFDSHEKSNGFGLQNIKMRADRTGADLKMETGRDNGTTWTIVMDI